MAIWNVKREAMGSTKIPSAIRERSIHIIRGSVFHTTKSQVVIGREGTCQMISLTKGIEAKEPTHYGSYWKKHPTLPLMFVYPNNSAYIRIGEFHVTSDVTHQDDMPEKKMEFGQYNLGIMCTSKPYNKKRLFCFENEEEEKEEENFLK